MEVPMTPMTRREQLEQWVEKKKMEKSSVMKEQENLKSFATPAKSALEIPYTTGKQVSLLGRNGVFSGSALQPISLTFATPMRVKPKLNEKFQTPVKNLNKFVQAEFSTPSYKSTAPSLVPNTPRPTLPSATIDRNAAPFKELIALLAINDLKPNVQEQLLQSVNVPERLSVLTRLLLALNSADYDNGQNEFIDLYESGEYGSWLRERAMFWMAWAALQERHSLFERAADLYAQAVDHRAQPAAAIAHQLQRSARRHIEVALEKEKEAQAATIASAVAALPTPLPAPSAAPAPSTSSAPTAPVSEADEDAAALAEFEAMEKEAAEVMMRVEEKKAEEGWVDGAEADMLLSPSKRRIRAETPHQSTPLGKAARVVQDEDEEEDEEELVPYNERIRMEIESEAKAASAGAKLKEEDVKSVLTWLNAHWGFKRVSELVVDLDSVISALKEDTVKATAEDMAAEEKKSKKSKNAKAAQEIATPAKAVPAAEALRRYSQMMPRSEFSSFRKLEEEAASPAPAPTPTGTRRSNRLHQGDAKK